MTALSPHVDVEEIQTTKSEKLLAVVLAAFLLVGGIWAYQKIDDSIRVAVEPRPPRLTAPRSIVCVANERLVAAGGRAPGPRGDGAHPGGL